LPPHPAPGQVSFVLGANEYCVSCHDDLELRGYVHPPVAAGDCVACHSPHTTTKGHLRRPRQIDLCLACHPGLITDEMTTLHGSIAQGVCFTCHSPHAAPYAGLLVKEFPREPFVSYSDKEYELCFSCHSREILLFPDTSFATDFRDGDRNLHFLHVNRTTRGRNCSLCHAIHGGSLTSLVADTVPFGIWGLPLNFEKTENGGACTPGCHARFSYDRKKPLEPLSDKVQ
jgi:predicted CXXCH cytochrome family protein